jgi:hypothetical protein
MKIKKTTNSSILNITTNTLHKISEVFLFTMEFSTAPHRGQLIIIECIGNIILL